MYEDVKIKEIPFPGERGLRCKVTILTGGFTQQNPGAYMDEVVRKYTKDTLYNQFVESHLDMPWIRVIISGINGINFEPFTNQHLDDKG